MTVFATQRDSACS